MQSKGQGCRILLEIKIAFDLDDIKITSNVL